MPAEFDAGWSDCIQSEQPERNAGIVVSTVRTACGSGRLTRNEINVATNERDLIVGGQAVIEGVMMRTPSAYAIAVRKADGTIVNSRGRCRSGATSIRF